MMQQHSESGMIGTAMAANHREYLDMDTDEEEFGHQESGPELAQDEAPVEPDRPSYTAQELQQLVDLATKLSTSSPGGAGATELCREFFREPSRALLWLRSGSTSRCSWLARAEPWQVYQPADFRGSVVFGNFSGASEYYAWRLVTNLFPGGCCRGRLKRSEVRALLDEVAARALELAWPFDRLGLLLLHVPRIEAEDESEDGPATRARLGRLASAWVSRIRLALACRRRKLPHRSSVDVPDDLDDEFRFWLARYDNTSLVSRQMQTRSFACTLDRLDGHSADELRSLGRRVDRARREAAANLARLRLLLDSCDADLALEDSIARTLRLICLVSTEWSFYAERENLERLLAAVGAQIAKRLASGFDGQDVFRDPLGSKRLLESRLACCRFYARLFDDVVEGCDWAAARACDRRAVLGSVDGFAQRCQVVVEVCDALAVYGALGRAYGGLGAPGPGAGPLEARYGAGLADFQDMAEKLRARSGKSTGSALDGAWFRDGRRFRRGLRRLELVVSAVFEELFQECRSLEAAVESLYALLKFRARPALARVLREKSVLVWRMFQEEVDAARHRESPAVLQDQLKSLPRTAAMSHGGKYLRRLQKIMIDASDWLGDCSDYYHRYSSATQL